MTADTKPLLTTLEDLLAYRHAGAVSRYAKEQGATLAEAEEVFREAVK